MKKPSLSIFPLFAAGVCLVVLVLTGPTEALIDHPKFKSGSADIIPGRYIISFNEKSASSGKAFVQSFQKNFKKADMKVHQDYQHEFFNGMSVRIDSDEFEVQKAAIESILDRSDVGAVYPVRKLHRPTVKLHSKKKHEEVSILPHAMTQVDLVHSKLKNKGKGIFVGVLDTGVDYMHPALGGGFGKGFKVIKGFDLVGDDYTGSNTPKPDSNPLDECGKESGASGHGTHVSGIIAGYDKKNNFTGVAPEASLGMWRVFGCDGSSGNDVIIKALLMAYDAGVDVINLSLGETNSWSNSVDAENEVVNKIVKKGVSVIISAGNEGAQGAFTVGQPSTAVNAFSIASVDNDYYVSESFNATGIDHAILYTAAGDDTIEDGPIAISDKNPGGASDSCSSDSVSPEVKGKLALIQRGSCNFSDKVKNAASAGAVGAIIYNNVPGSFSASVPNAEIPTVSISLKDGQELIAAIKKGDDVDLTFDKEGHVVPVTTGGTVSSFSSVGPSAELNFKPNVAGIGGTVYSTLPRYLGSWGVMSGTSMAAPYVAGSVALYRKAHGNTKAVKFINEQFQNYAAPTKVFNVSDTDSPLRQGAGLVQVYDAITEQIHTSPAEMSFNDTATTKYRKQTIVITNKGSKTASYKLYNKPSTAIDPYDVEKTGYTFIEPVSTTSDAAKLRFSKKKIRIAPGKSEKITVTVTPPDSDPKDHIMYGGFIQLKSEHEGNAKDIHVPYFGIVGVQSELPIFDEGFPTIIDKKGKEYPTNMTFVYDRSKNNTEPIPVIRLLTPTAHIKADLLDEDEDVIGKAFIGLDYMGRNFLTKSQYSNHPWDATYIPSSVPGVSIPIPVPSGTYRIRFSALKLLANPTKKESWETWTSGEIEVKN